MYRQRAVSLAPNLIENCLTALSSAFSPSHHISVGISTPLSAAKAFTHPPFTTLATAPASRYSQSLSSSSLRLFSEVSSHAVPTQFEEPPVSLEVPADEGTEDEMSTVAGSNSPLRRLLWLLGFNSSEAINIRAATRLYDAVCAQADTNGLHDSVHMEPVFYSRWCLLMLHVWMLIHRLSADGDATRVLRQELYDLFQEDVEVRVRQQIQVRVATTVTDLEKSFYGTALALDRALAGDEQLWEALHRNAYGGEDGKQAAAKLLSAYITRQQKCLEMTDSDALIRGRVRFSFAK
eukprot:jgi/Ulvmu1/6103/UM027_0081.1